MGRLARTLMVVGGTAVLVATPQDDYARLWAGTQVAAMRAYALLDRHIVRPIRVATGPRQDTVIAEVPTPRPAVRPSLLNDGARRGLADVRIPDVSSPRAEDRVPGVADQAVPTAREEQGQAARAVAIDSGSEVSSTRVAADADGVVIAKVHDTSAVVASPVAAGSGPVLGTAGAPYGDAAPAVPSSPPVAAQAVSTTDVALHVPGSVDDAAADAREKAGSSTDVDTESAGIPPPPSEKPEVPDDKKPPPAAKLLFGAAKTAAPLAARSIGFYSRGCLSGAKALPVDGPAWQAMRLSRNRNWGHPKLVALLERFANDVQKEDGWAGLLVGDISQPRGGPMLTGHSSHQIGLDADIWFTPMPGRRLSRRERETLSATSMILGPTKVDPSAFTASHVRVVKRAASYPEVERILVHPAIKKALCEAAGTDRKWLSKVRPYFGHYYHFHVRIACPTGSGNCRPQNPTGSEDGCGKELDTWFRRLTRPDPPKPKDVKPRPPKPPVTLADMPQECRAVLESGDGPLAQDEAELVKTSIERSKEIIDISGVPRSKLMQDKAQQ